MLDYQQRTADVGTTFLSVDCVLGDDPAITPFYLKSLLFLCLPLMIAVAPLFVFVPYWLIMRGTMQGIGKRLKNVYATTVIVCLFLIHPLITQQGFYMLSCKSLGTDDDKYLIADLSQKCYTAKHYTWLLLVGIPMLMLFTVGIPVSAFYLLRANEAKLQSDEQTRMRLSFLYNGYEQKWYWWELVVVARKVLLVSLAVFFSDAPHVQSLLAVLLVTGALMLHVYAAPFRNPTMTKMEFFSLATTFITFFCGQFLFIESLTDGAKQFFSVSSSGQTCCLS
jgi:hypothetical protein